MPTNADTFTRSPNTARTMTTPTKIRLMISSQRLLALAGFVGVFDKTSSLILIPSELRDDASVPARMGVACGVEVCNVEHPGRSKRPRNRHHPQKKLINTRRGEGGEGWPGGPLWSPGGGGQAHRASTSRSLQVTHGGRP